MKRLPVSLLVVVVLSLAACGGLPAPRVASVHDFGFSRHEQRLGRDKLYVTASDYVDERIRYRFSNENELRHYRDSRWLGNPSELFAEAWSAQLKRLGTCRLSVHIQRFEQEISGAGSTLWLAFDASIPESGRLSRLLRVPLASADAAGVVSAAPRLAEEAARVIDHWLADQGCIKGV